MALCLSCIARLDRPKQFCSAVKFLSGLARWNASGHIYVLGVVKFLFSLASMYSFLEFKEFKLAPPRECSLIVFAVVLSTYEVLQYCSFKSHSLCFTNNFFCLDSLLASTSERVKMRIRDRYGYVRICSPFRLSNLIFLFSLNPADPQGISNPA